MSISGSTHNEEINKIDWGSYFKGFEKLHTKQLLQKLQYINECADYRYYDKPFVCGYDCPYTNGDVCNRIKEMLAIGEHIPNKKEAKKIRQEKFKRKK